MSNVSYKKEYYSQAAALNSALPLIDYGARMYDPVIARWMSVDSLAEKYYPMGKGYPSRWTKPYTEDI